MTVVQFDVCDDRLVDLLDAIRRYAPSRLRVFRETPRPQSPRQETELQRLAGQIARAITPKSDSPNQVAALRLVLEGGDTFTLQEGEPDPGLRNAIGGLSKKLRRFDRFAESPVELLCERRREVFSRGQAKGIYKGMRYIPNALAGRVLKILRDTGQL